MSNPFQLLTPNLDKVRVPQRGAFEALLAFAASSDEAEREVGIILPVGCGKSGCITLAPFAFKSRRALVVAPGLNIAHQLAKDFTPNNAEMFYRKCAVLSGPLYPEPVEIRGTTTNRGDLDEADVVITNIQQLQGEENRWMNKLPGDYFDLILFDEGHHSVAETYETLKKRFPKAKIVNFSATPQRADGQIMAGRILYSFPVARAIKEGYVKRLTAFQLNPRTLKYVRKEGEKEIEVSLDEVRRLGEQDADFRRSIVTSKETVKTIVDASINQLNRLRKETDEPKLKIIASALNFQHCHQIVEAYRARGLEADFVHSKAEGDANKKVLKKLECHELDVIVQVRKLGEGFDHKYLSVAAVFSIFSNLSPFVQFVGRIMRVVVQNSPGHLKNQGVVVFHAGANIANRWADFRDFSDADQEYFDQLLPLEGLEPNSRDLSREYTPDIDTDNIDVREQSEVHVQEIALIPDDEKAAVELLLKRGKISEEQAASLLQPVPTTKAQERQAKRQSLDSRCLTAAAIILKKRKVNPGGRNLDKTHTRTNLVVMKSAIDKQVNKSVGKKSGERSEFTRPELDEINANFESILAVTEKEVFRGN